MQILAIIGAGQLGSRHLQALANISQPFTIYVVDPQEQALQTTKQRFEEIDNPVKKDVYYVNTIENIPERLDLVIVATNSVNRRAVIEEFLASKKIRYLILEKFLFPALSDYEAVQKLLSAKSVKTWVNCSRRAVTLYKEIAKSIKGTIQFSVVGSDWGLACSTIHFLDLFSVLSSSDSYQVAFSHIDDNIQASKRQGYIEFTGSLHVTGNNGDIFEAVSYKDGSHPVIVKISSPEEEWIINETKRGYVCLLKSHEWQPVTGQFNMPLQSEIGATIVKELIETGDCSLPTYNESQYLHKILLELFVDKFNTLSKIENGETCLIT